MNQRLLDPFFSLKLQTINKANHYVMYSRNFFPLLVFITLFSLSVFAQLPVDVNNVSDAQIEQFLNEMERRGLSDSEIETAARLQGYSTTEIALIREKISRYKAGALSDSTMNLNQTTRRQIGEVAERTTLQVDQSEKIEIKAEVFGKELFSNKQLSFEPNLRIPTPKNYILGPDDQLKVDISGYAYQHYDLIISPEGTVKIESLSPIYVNGSTIEEAKSKIVERLKMLFGGLRNGSLTADVTLGNVRSIQVTVAGEAQMPGTYTLSSLSKVYNALYACGGPGLKGSYRKVKLIRNNIEVSEIDLYTFLTKGISTGNIRLEDQDLIFIPLAEIKVELSGELKRKAIFELKQEETLVDAINLAGGFSEFAYRDKITLIRNTSKEKKIYTVGLDKMDLQSMKNGDKVIVNAILDRFENRVEILGAVYRPGVFALSDNLKTVKDLVDASDGPRDDAFLKRVIVIRENSSLDPEIISINLENILADKENDFSLKRNDRVIIKSLVELREERFIEISGAVNQPGEYGYSENMKVEDLILLAGGFSEGATLKRIEIARRLFNDENSDQTVEVFSYETNRNLESTKGIVLAPFDKIFIRELPNYEEQKLVSVVGEVNYPGKYTLQRREERISDLIERSGGFRKEAYLEGARFYRGGELLALDLPNAMINNGDYGNLMLEKGDSIVIPKRAEIVKLSGQVLNPTTIAYQPNLNFSDYIAQAGGFTDSAFVRKIYVRYANGLTDRTRSFMGIKNFPEVQRGMEVIVPTRRKTRWTGAERISVSTGIVSLSAVLLTLFRLI